MDIMKKLSEQMDRVFRKPEPEPDESTPEHLRPLPAEAVRAVCDRIAAETGGLISYGIRLELAAFRETRTPHDGRRVERALRHVLRREDLADAVETLINRSTR